MLRVQDILRANQRNKKQLIFTHILLGIKHKIKQQRINSIIKRKCDIIQLLKCQYGRYETVGGVLMPSDSSAWREKKIIFFC